MKHSIIVGIFLLIVMAPAAAQDFIMRGKIEYEVKKNLARMMSEVNPESDYFSNSTKYSVTYRDLIFTPEQFIYMATPKKIGSSYGGYNESIVFTDLNKQQRIIKKRFLEDEYVFSDTVHTIKWKIENEMRTIAGWKCRKAIGRVYDSVYIVAFYCPEIIPQGGPEMISGLPGMILGLAIPRYYTTWFATRVEIIGVDESKIVPPSIKKEKQYTKKELSEMLNKKYKDLELLNSHGENYLTKLLNDYIMGMY